ncbi:MAG: hypothetical protein WC782_08585 [Methylococcaceae bacterium]|jgi:hypothetical protein
MPYTKVQFISYQINTFPVANNFGIERYLGAVASKTDIKYRCEFMCKAIDEAAGSAQLSNSSNTLKLFMAPEFYFRGKDGAYPIEEVSTIMETLRKHTKANQFRDWLFVFGTALGFLDEGSSKEIFNIAMVQKGGTEDTGVDSSLIVYKEYISHIDFIRTKKTGQNCPNCGHFVEDDWDTSSNRSGKLGTGHHTLRPTTGSRDLLSMRVEKTGTGREKTKTGLGGQAIFNMNGITFGLEICLDHLNGRLRDSPPAKGDARIQIQLIPSAGAYIEEASVACMQGGLIFNVDGNDQTQINRNKGDEQNPKLLYAGHPNAIRVIDTIDLDTGLSSAWKGFFSSPGYVHIIEEQGVPVAKKL